MQRFLSEARVRAFFDRKEKNMLLQIGGMCKVAFPAKTIKGAYGDFRSIDMYVDGGNIGGERRHAKINFTCYDPYYFSYIDGLKKGDLSQFSGLAQFKFWKDSAGRDNMSMQVKVVTLEKPGLPATTEWIEKNKVENQNKSKGYNNSEQTNKDFFNADAKDYESQMSSNEENLGDYNQAPPFEW